MYFTVYGRDQNPDPPVGEQKQDPNYDEKKGNNWIAIGLSIGAGAILVVALVVAAALGYRYFRQKGPNSRKGN